MIEYLISRSKILFLSPILTMLSCASLQNQGSNAVDYREEIARGNCDVALLHMQMEKEDTQFLSVYQSSVGYLAYTTTIPLTVGLDLGHYLLLSLGCKYGCSFDDTRGKPFMEALFPTSTYTYENMKGLRCPNEDYYVQKVLEISECFEKKGDTASLQRSSAKLASLKAEFEHGPTCMKIRDYKIIGLSLERVEGKLHSDEGVHHEEQAPAR